MNPIDLTNFLGSSFLQTPTWEQFQQARGSGTYWLDNVLFIKHELKWGQSYWYAPRVSNPPALERIDSVFKDHTTFVKVELQKGKLDKPFIAAPSRQPRETILLDLTQSEDEILNNCKTKTRYNIRLAERKGVQVVRYDYPDSAQRLSEFMALIKQTNLRDQIKSYDETYYAKLLQTLGPTGMATLWVAYHEGIPLTSLFLIRHNGVATYLFGASSSQKRNLMASHLIQWHAIQFAKSQGDKIYDFSGVRVDHRVAQGTPEELIDPAQMQPSPGKTYGVTKFKLGFGGLIYMYPPAYDRSYKQFWYNLYKGYRGVSKSSGFNY